MCSEPAPNGPPVHNHHRARQEVSLTVGADATVNFTLAVGALQQTETVTASSEFGQIEVAKSQPRSAIVARQVEALPVLDRNVLALAQLLPGSGPDNSLAGAQRFAVSKFGATSPGRRTNSNRICTRRGSSSSPLTRPSIRTTRAPTRFHSPSSSPAVTVTMPARSVCTCKILLPPK